MEKIKYRNYHIIIRRKSKNKNTYFRVETDGSLVITCPFHIETSVLMPHIDDFIDKIERKYDNTGLNKLDYLDGGQLYYLGDKYQIDYVLSDKNYCCLDSNKLLVYTNSEDAQKVKSIVDKFIKKEAEKIIKKEYVKMLEIFDLIDFVPELKIKKIKNKFGVCYYKKSLIYLSTQLLHYDIDCIDYVIIHELSHFIQPNHSKSFYRVIERYLPDYKSSEKKLKNIRID